MAKVLIIDDSPTVIVAVSAALTHDGHEVHALVEFSQLGHVLERVRPDVIVLDLLMPGFNGIQFARFVKRFSENPPPIVLYSGSDAQLVRLAAKEIAPFEIVPKSANERDLRRAVARAVADRRKSTGPVRSRATEPGAMATGTATAVARPRREGRS